MIHWWFFKLCFAILIDKFFTWVPNHIKCEETKFSMIYASINIYQNIHTNIYAKIRNELNKVFKLQNLLKICDFY